MNPIAHSMHAHKSVRSTKSCNLATSKMKPSWMLAMIRFLCSQFSTTSRRATGVGTLAVYVEHIEYQQY